PELVELLRQQRRRVAELQLALGEPVPWVFPHFLTSTGKKVWHRTVAGKRRLDYKVVWRTACRKAGLEGTLKHDMRRSAARNLIRAGVDSRVVMSYTGHKSRSMLDRYNITDQERDDAAAAEKLTRYLEASSDKLVTNEPVSGVSGVKHAAQVIN